MKRLGVSVILAVLIVMLLCPAAWADDDVNLGSFNQNDYISLLLTVVYGHSFDVSQPTGSGLSVTQNIHDNGIGIYLEGIPSAQGSFSCNFYDYTDPSKSTTYYFTVIPSSSSVLPAPSYPNQPQTPVVASSGHINCQIGDRALVSAAASVSDGGTLSYQWYGSYSPVNYGGSPINGANGPELLADTSQPGTVYYYCVVTNNLGGMQANASSSPVAVTVSQPQIEAVQINSLPLKTEYKVGDTLSTAGLTLIAYHSNGDQEVLYTGFSCAPTSFASAGEVMVQVNYNGWLCSFPVQVSAKEAAVSSISVLTMPSKTTYNVGDVLDTNGLVCRVYKSDGSQEDVRFGFSCSPTVLNTPGTQNITVNYNGSSCQFSVSVQAKNALEVTSTPAKLKYSVGDRLDTAGLVLKLNRNGSSQIISSGFVCEPSVFTTVGTQTVKVSYGGESTTFTVSVQEAKASPSPAPGSQSPGEDGDDEGGSGSQSQSQSRPSQNKSGKRTMLWIMLVACVVCLVALGAYMMYLKNYHNDRDWR